MTSWAPVWAKKSCHFHLRVSLQSWAGYPALSLSLTWMLTNPEQIATWDLGEIHLGFCAPTVELLKILAKRTHHYFFFLNNICGENKNLENDINQYKLLLQNNIVKRNSFVSWKFDLFLWRLPSNRHRGRDRDHPWNWKFGLNTIKNLIQYLVNKDSKQILSVWAMFIGFISWLDFIRIKWETKLLLFWKRETR